MKQTLTKLIMASALMIFVASSCNKSETPENAPLPSSYSAEVVDKWLGMQLRLMKNATGIPNHGLARHFAYSGIAALESMAGGLPANNNWARKWNGLTNLPTFNHSVRYYYPANVNAALAEMNRKMFPNANANDKQAIDSLEHALTQQFLITEPAAIIQVSADFGKAVAIAVYGWSQTDGHQNASQPYTPPTFPGAWVPATPGQVAATPYWGNNRPVIQGSITNTTPGLPPAYSEEPGTPFYEMAKEVYDVSQILTQDQKNMVNFWKDVPGATTPGHWVSILQQVIKKTDARLDKAVLAYAASGSAMNDASITCFKTKYTYPLLRPITYIRNTLGHQLWTAQIGTPAHPEFPSAHSSLSMATAEAMQRIFGDIGSFTDHTYDYLGYPARTYSSIRAIAEEAGQSRLYAGIHYQYSINAGFFQGKKVVQNIFSKH